MFLYTLMKFKFKFNLVWVKIFEIVGEESLISEVLILTEFQHIGLVTYVTIMPHPYGDSVFWT